MPWLRGPQPLADVPAIRSLRNTLEALSVTLVLETSLLVNASELSEVLATALPALGLNGILAAFHWADTQDSTAAQDTLEWGESAAFTHGSPALTQPLVQGAGFQMIHLVGSWAMDCALRSTEPTVQRADVLGALGQRESVTSALDSGAPLHAAMWRAVLDHLAIRMRWSNTGHHVQPKPNEVWEFVLRLCAPFNRSVTAMSSCVHGAGHGFLMGAMAPDLEKAGYDGCQLFSYAVPHAISTAALSQATQMCSAAPAAQYAWYCSCAAPDQLSITMRWPGGGDLERRTDASNSTSRRVRPWHWPCAVLPEGSAALCFIMYGARRSAWRGIESCMSEGKGWPNSSRLGCAFATGFVRLDSHIQRLSSSLRLVFRSSPGEIGSDVVSYCRPYLETLLLGGEAHWRACAVGSLVATWMFYWEEFRLSAAFTKPFCAAFEHADTEVAALCSHLLRADQRGAIDALLRLPTWVTRY